jgi:hypothetical protein
LVSKHVADLLHAPGFSGIIAMIRHPANGNTADQTSMAPRWIG